MNDDIDLRDIKRLQNPVGKPRFLEFKTPDPVKV